MTTRSFVDDLKCIKVTIVQEIPYNYEVPNRRPQGATATSRLSLMGW